MQVGITFQQILSSKMDSNLDFNSPHERNMPKETSHPFYFYEQLDQNEI